MHCVSKPRFRSPSTQPISLHYCTLVTAKKVNECDRVYLRVGVRELFSSSIELEGLLTDWWVWSSSSPPSWVAVMPTEKVRREEG